MNKHGQTLGLFVILIPILLLLGAIVVDMGVVINSKVKTKEVAKTAIRENFDNLDEEKIKEIFDNNKISVLNLEIIKSYDKINIKNKYEVASILGAIIGIKSYSVKIDVTGIRKNKKIIFE